jgi:hypothetical protein
VISATQKGHLCTVPLKGHFGWQITVPQMQPEGVTVDIELMLCVDFGRLLVSRSGNQ